MKALNVVGTHPNFIKIATIVELMKTILEIHGNFAHTGPHYGQEMSDIFFQELGIPRPEIHLSVGSETDAEQTARVLAAFENVCLTESRICYVEHHDRHF